MLMLQRIAPCILWQTQLQQLRQENSGQQQTTTSQSDIFASFFLFPVSIATQDNVVGQKKELFFARK